MLKKAIVLSDVEKKSDKKAVLTLQEDENGIVGSVRLYNFSKDLDGISSLGLFANQTVYKAGLTLKSHMYYQFFIGLKSIPQKFSCAVVNFQNAQAKPILYGSSEGNNDDIYASIIAQISADNSLENTQKVLDKYGVDFADEEKEVIEKEIDACLDCENCKYKKFYFENLQKNDVKIEKNAKKDEKIADFSEKDEIIQEEEQENILFFDKLKPQIDKLFETYPFEENLQKMFPSSKWVKVDYQEDGDFYVFGLLYDEEQQVKYVCYGIPAIYEQKPPKELSGFPVWLPLDKDNVEGFGYWITYQDACTGEPVKAIIE